MNLFTGVRSFWGRLLFSCNVTSAVVLVVLTVNPPEKCGPPAESHGHTWASASCGSGVS